MDLSFVITRKMLRFSNRIVNMRSERLQNFDLTPGQSETLQFFCKNAGSTATDLKGHLNISHQAARNMAARLMAKGLLSSSFSEEDGRSKRIFPTPEGERVYRALIADGSDAGEDLFSALSLPEKEELNRLLDKLNRVIEKALQ